jgi:hypothetical protein
MQSEQRVIIRFLANRNWEANDITAALKEDFGKTRTRLEPVKVS